jgi:hypothetical protein
MQFTGSALEVHGIGPMTAGKHFFFFYDPIFRTGDPTMGIVNITGVELSLVIDKPVTGSILPLEVV